jgi:hypothetical protein
MLLWGHETLHEDGNISFSVAVGSEIAMANVTKARPETPEKRKDWFDQLPWFYHGTYMWAEMLEKDGEPLEPKD